MVSVKLYVCPIRCCLGILAVLGSSGDQIEKLLYSRLLFTAFRLLGETVDIGSFCRLRVHAYFCSWCNETYSILPWEYVLGLKHCVRAFFIVIHFSVLSRQWSSSFLRRQGCRCCHHHLLWFSLLHHLLHLPSHISTTLLVVLLATSGPPNKGQQSHRPSQIMSNYCKKTGHMISTYKLWECYYGPYATPNPKSLVVASGATSAPSPPSSTVYFLLISSYRSPHILCKVWVSPKHSPYLWILSSL